MAEDNYLTLLMNTLDRIEPAPTPYAIVILVGDLRFRMWAGWGAGLVEVVDRMGKVGYEGPILIERF